MIGLLACSIQTINESQSSVGERNTLVPVHHLVLSATSACQLICSRKPAQRSRGIGINTVYVAPCTLSHTPSEVRALLFASTSLPKPRNIIPAASPIRSIFLVVLFSCLPSSHHPTSIAFRSTASLISQTLPRPCRSPWASTTATRTQTGSSKVTMPGS